MKMTRTAENSDFLAIWYRWVIDFRTKIPYYRRIECMIVRCFLLKKEVADLVMKSGMIYSADERGSVYEALAVKDGKIIFLGSDEEVEKYVTETTSVMMLDGKMILPGFIDAHMHPSANVDTVFGIDLNDYTTEEEYLRVIREAVDAAEERNLLYGYGWIAPAFENGIPDKTALDEITEKIPVVLWDQGYHNMWVNSKALEMAGIRSDTYCSMEGIVRDEQQVPVGMLKEKATSLMSDSLCDYDEKQYEENLILFEKQMLSLGITSVFDACIYPAEGKPGYPGINALESLIELDRRKLLKINYSSAIVVDPEMELNEENVARIDRMRARAAGKKIHVDTIKIYIDGTIEGATAYLYEDYADRQGDRGQSNWEDDMLCRYSDYFNRKGYSLHYHAIGDAAVGQALDGIAYAQKHSGRKNRYGIAHIQLLSDRDLERFKELNVAAVVQPFWFHPDDYYDMMKWLIGEERADKQYPLECYFKKGVIAASSSDFPVTPEPNPLVSIACGCTRQNCVGESTGKYLPPLAECATVEQMIRMVTLDAAKSMGIENERGSLEIGKAADLVVLDRNILEIPEKEIGQVKILYTLADGEIVYNGGNENEEG